MDSSDITKKRKAKAIYIDQLATFIAKNPNGDCGNLSTCVGVSTCVMTFPSYENKYDFFTGQNNCADCTCAVNGGSK
jgi:hypothetical protein